MKPIDPKNPKKVIAPTSDAPSDGGQDDARDWAINAIEINPINIAIVTPAAPAASLRLKVLDGTQTAMRAENDESERTD